MPEEAKVVDAASLESLLASQVFSDDRQPAETAVEEKAETTTSDPEQAPTDDKPAGDDGTATPEVDSQEETPSDGQQKTVKLGNREFQTADEAMREAERVIGHNANLASELTSIKQSLSERESKLEEAMEANRKWAEWAEANAKGEEKVRPDEPKLEDVVRKVLEEREARDQMKTVEQQMREQVDELQTLTNFDAVLPMLKELADKPNPTTGKYFSPKEAYEYSCWKLGLVNELAVKPVEAKPPVSPAAGALKAAARPVGTPKATVKQEEPKTDEISDMLSQYL